MFKNIFGNSLFNSNSIKKELSDDELRDFVINNQNFKNINKDNFGRQINLICLDITQQLCISNDNLGTKVKNICSKEFIEDEEELNEFDLIVDDEEEEKKIEIENNKKLFKEIKNKINKENTIDKKKNLNELNLVSNNIEKNVNQKMIDSSSINFELYDISKEFDLVTQDLKPAENSTKNFKKKFVDSKRRNKNTIENKKNEKVIVPYDISVGLVEKYLNKNNIKSDDLIFLYVDNQYIEALKEHGLDCTKNDVAEIIVKSHLLQPISKNKYQSLDENFTVVLNNEAFKDRDESSIYIHQINNKDVKMKSIKIEKNIAGNKIKFAKIENLLV